MKTHQRILVICPSVLLQITGRQVLHQTLRVQVLVRQSHLPPFYLMFFSRTPGFLLPSYWPVQMALKNGHGCVDNRPAGVKWRPVLLADQIYYYAFLLTTMNP